MDWVCVGPVAFLSHCIRIWSCFDPNRWSTRPGPGQSGIDDPTLPRYLLPRLSEWDFRVYHHQHPSNRCSYMAHISRCISAMLNLDTSEETLSDFRDKTRDFVVALFLRRVRIIWRNAFLCLSFNLKFWTVK